MRLETRPEGREAVERQTVSGWKTEEVWAELYQLWNWAMGLGERSLREREESVNCSATVVEGDEVGATGKEGC